jgi:hypothetical protein
MKLFVILFFLFIGHLTIAQTAPIGNPSPKRTIISKPNFSSIQSTENCQIMLKITLNSEGNISGQPVVVKDSRTTTSNMELINQVLEIVKKETVYSKSDKEFETTYLTIKISGLEELPVLP